MNGSPRLVTILGSTGSIGRSTLEVIARHPGRFQVHALAARRSVDAIFEQCQSARPQFAALACPDAAAELKARLQAAGMETRVLAGESGVREAAADPAADTVMAAIVGAAGLEPALAAVGAGKRVLLANKESLVMAGGLFMQAVRDSGATLLPIDSEHNAIFQCMPPSFPRLLPPSSGESSSPSLPSSFPRKRESSSSNFPQSQPGVAEDGTRADGVRADGVKKILLTASGGPFRDWSPARMRAATPEQACAHPNWTMGRKISVDSATMMNKGLEIIEACHLFNVRESEVEVVVHPQSIVHSMVQYADGSVLAQLGNPDMRAPIAHGLAWPERISSGVADLDMIGIAQLDFAAPDPARFPCLELARAAARAGGLAPAWLNAANEVAVAAFLAGEIGFADIPALIAEVMDAEVMGAKVMGNGADAAEPDSLQRVKQADEAARRMARELLESRRLRPRRFRFGLGFGRGSGDPAFVRPAAQRA